MPLFYPIFYGKQVKLFSRGPAAPMCVKSRIVPRILTRKPEKVYSD